MIGTIQNNFPQNIDRAKQSNSGNLECLKNRINRLDNAALSNTELTKEVFTILSPIVPIRRLSSLPDNIKDGNYARAAGLVGLMAINLPEDTRDLKSSFKQIFKGELPKYDYKNYQVPFSFIRGTALQPLVNKMGKYGVKVHSVDKPLYETKLGSYLSKIFKFDAVDYTATGRIVPQVYLDEISGKYKIGDIGVVATKVEGTPVGKLIGNGLLRIPLISTVLLTALELPAIIKAFSKSNKTKEKAIDGGTQILKSGVNVSSVLTGIGIFGALLKNRGPVGSLIGMGIGSAVGAYTSKNIGIFLDFEANKLKN